MSDESESVPSGALDDGDLAAALAEDPEAVAAFVRRLDDVNELLDVLALATEAADDEMVSSVAGTAGSLGELADEAAEPETIRGARTLLRALGDAGDPETTYREVGALGLLRALRDPEVKRGLAFLVALARGIGRELERGER
jgi:uncharacterized protein YjgD (DUF1641 family)